MSEKYSSRSGSGGSSGEGAAEHTGGDAIASSASAAGASVERGTAEVSIAPAQGHETPSVREVIGALSLRDEVAFSWHTVERLADANPDRARELVAQAYQYREFVPAVAGALVREEEPATEVAWPTAQQVKAHALPGIVGGIIDHLPGGLGTYVDGILEHKARERVERIAEMVARPFRAITRFESPRAELLDELQRLHDAIVRSEGPNAHPAHMARELRQFLGQFNIWNLAGGDEQHQARNPSLHREQYPLVDGVLRSISQVNLRTGLLLRGHLGVRVAAPEIVQGLEGFLQAHGIEVAPAAVEQRGTLLRRVVGRFAPRVLSRVPAQVEAALQQAYELLPENGHRFRDEVLALCRKVNEAALDAIAPEDADVREQASGSKDKPAMPADDSNPCPDNDPDCRNRRR